MKKILFYILSFTWGLPLTLVGLIVATVLLICGYKPHKHGYCFYFEIGKNWGGLELGVVFLTNKNPSTYIKNHEYGHALQNCVYGLFMPFIVCIPSAIRYWYRKIRTKKGLENRTKYNDIWFESQANEWGQKFYNHTIAKEVTEEVNACTDCIHFISCECFDGKICDKFERI